MLNQIEIMLMVMATCVVTDAQLSVPDIEEHINQKVSLLLLLLLLLCCLPMAAAIE